MLPTIEELDKIASEAAGLATGISGKYYLYVTAIVKTVVAACRPQLRPIAEMPEEVPNGCVRKFPNAPGWGFSGGRMHDCTHYIDIALPVEAYPSDFEAAFTESKLDAKDKAAAFKLWKGGVR